MEIGSAFVSILPSGRGFGSRLQSEVGGQTDGAGKKLGASFGKMFGAVAALGIGAAVGDFLKGSIEEARDAQVVGARTESVIKSMGNASKISAAQVGELAAALSNKTAVDDEAIQAGQNLLLTFGNVRNEVGKGNDIFSQTSGLMVDMSVAMGTDMKGSAIQLGKALNDPVKGVSALSRVGVSFTEQQKAQIKALTASGNVLGAQKVILREVKKQFGGAAASMATPAQRAEVAWGNLKEQIGTGLLPTVDRVLTAVSNKGIPAMSRFAKAAGPVLSKSFGMAKSASSNLFDAALPSIERFGAMFQREIAPTLTRFASTLRANFVPVLKTMATTFTTTILPAVTTFATYIGGKLLPVFQQVAGIIGRNVVPIIAGLAQFLYGTLYPAVAKIVTQIAGSLKPVFDQLVATFQAKVLPAVEKLLVKLREWQPTAQKVIMIVVKVVGAVLRLAAAILGKVLPPLIRLAGFLLGKVVGALAAVIGWVVKAVAKSIAFGSALINAGKKALDFGKRVGEAVAKVVARFKDMPGNIKTAVGNVSKLLLEKGKDVARGLWEGLKSMSSWLTDKVWDWVKSVLPGPVEKALGINSPSKVAAEQGRWFAKGLAAGINAEGNTVARAAEALANRARSSLHGGLGGLSLSGSTIDLRGPRLATPRLAAREVAVRRDSGQTPRQIVVNQAASPTQVAREVHRIDAWAGGF